MNRIILFILAVFIQPLNANAELIGQRLVDDILFKGLVISPELDTNGVVSQIGPPIETSFQQVTNKLSGLTDELVTLSYADLEIIIYNFKDPKHGWSKVSRVSVKSNTHKLPINIGLSKSMVIEKLGGKDPVSTEDTWYYFPSDEEPHLQLIVKFKNNSVSEVIWSYMP